MDHVLQARIAASLNIPPGCVTFTPINGGSINQTYRIDISDTPAAFFKTNSATKFPQLLEMEAKGLTLLQNAGIIKTPALIDLFTINDNQVLLMEWITPGSKTQAFWNHFGAQLAAIHSCTSPNFGLDHNNYMGAVQQTNTPAADWIFFFQHHRLQPLVEKSAHKGLLQPQHLRQFEKLYRSLPDLFEKQTSPSLLHGDLWSGNFICNNNQQPVLIDPAVYYGHSSIDLGMTTLFGGFHSRFYEAYHYHRPPEPNFKEQWEAAKLYPLLIHLLLFGASYRAPIENILASFQ